MLNQINYSDLESDRLLLRGITLTDQAFIYQHFSQNEVSQFFFDEARVSTPTDALTFIAQFTNPMDDTLHRWIIIEKQSMQAIGTCGFHFLDKLHYSSDIGYDLSQSYWGKGYINEALSCLIEYGFSQLHLHRLIAKIYVDNPRSYHALERLGFKREGLLRDFYYFDGKFYDHYLYSLLQGELIQHTNHNKG